MALTVEESKARRLAGMKRANQEMSAVERIQRSLVNGRPPASELKTPLAAVTAARVLHRELETRMAAEELNPQPGDWGVSIGYITADLSTLGFTRLYASGSEARLMEMLNGQIMLGLIFGMVNPDAVEEDKRIVMGTRPFLATKQTEAWLSELIPGVRLEIEYP